MSIKSDQLRISDKNPCRVATTANVDVSTGNSPLVVDGITLVAGNRVLVPNQTTGSENGIYRVVDPGTGSDGTWVRSTDADLAAQDQFFAGVNTYIQEGTLNAQTIFYLVTTGSITIGATSLEFIGRGPILRSDASGQAMTGVGTSGTPLAYSTSYTTQSDSSDLRDYSNATWYFYITNKSSATSITVKVAFSEDDSNFGEQRSEAISAGAATESVYEATFDISGETATFVLPISLRVAGPNSKVSIKADAGTPLGYVTVWRQV